MQAYKAPQYDTPYHEQTSTHLLKELTIASNMSPDDTYYHRLFCIASGCAPNVLTFIDKLSIDINARISHKAMFSNDAEYVAECDRLISEHTLWIARCKAISDDLTDQDELEPLGVDFLPDLD